MPSEVRRIDELGERQAAARNSSVRMSNSSFVIASDSEAIQDIDKVMAFVNRAEEKRADLGYEIDGVVVKIDSAEVQRRLGYTGRAPRWAVAYKFTARAGITKIEDIRVQVGRTGKLTPVAKLAPVFVGGVLGLRRPAVASGALTIRSRASLVPPPPRGRVSAACWLAAGRLRRPSNAPKRLQHLDETEPSGSVSNL